MRSALLTTLLAVVAASCGPGDPEGRPSSLRRETRAEMVVLSADGASLRERFNADSGKVRLLLLLSPT